MNHALDDRDEPAATYEKCLRDNRSRGARIRDCGRKRKELASKRGGGLAGWLAEYGEAYVKRSSSQPRLVFVSRNRILPAVPIKRCARKWCDERVESSRVDDADEELRPVGASAVRAGGQGQAQSGSVRSMASTTFPGRRLC